MRVRYRYLAVGAPSTHPADEIERLYHESLDLGRATLRSSEWHPPTDVYEMPDRFVIKIEIAGVREEDIDVALFPNRLMVSGHRHPTSFPPDAPMAYHLAGVRYGQFSIHVRLPAPIDSDTVEAVYDQGFLVVTLLRLPVAPNNEQKVHVHVGH